MLNKIQRWIIIFSGAALYTMMFGTATPAQVTPDGTLGTEVQLNENTYEITGGSTAGNNLFHSFEDFSSNAKNVFFNNIDSIENIISRVTGANASFIDGILKANGAANVILLNPNGITFGTNAQLQIGGAFVGTTAPELVFEDGTVLSTNPNSPVNLTISVPIGLQWNGTEPPAKIIVDGSTLWVGQGQVLVLMGGDVEVRGDNGTGKQFDRQLNAEGGRIELGGLKGAGTILIDLDENGNFVFPSGGERGDVTIRNGADLFVRSDGGGDVNINAKNFIIEGGGNYPTNIEAGIASDQGSPEAQAGNVIINATETVRIDGTNGIARIFNKVDSRATGNGGNVDIKTGSLELINGGSIQLQILGKGDGGDIIINAAERVLLDGSDKDARPASLLNEVGNIPTIGTGNAGTIQINTANLEVLNGGLVSVVTHGQGDAGQILINTSDRVVFDGERLQKTQVFSSAATTAVQTGAEGNAGRIKINARSLELLNGGALSNRIAGKGYGGEILINATDKVVFEGERSDGFSSSIVSEVLGGEQPGMGNAGRVEINTSSFQVLNGAFVQVSTFGKGDAGDININADQVVLDGVRSDGEASSLLSEVGSEAEGKAGDIQINTASLEVLNGADISANTSGVGSAGNIFLNATENVMIDGTAPQEPASNINAPENPVNKPEETDIQRSSIESSVAENATGNGGNIEINSGSILVTNEAAINTNTAGEGKAGTINIETTGDVSITNNGRISSNSEEGSTAQGGNILIEAGDDLTLENNGSISTDSNTSDGGNLTIDVVDILLLDEGKISASALPQKTPEERVEETNGGNGGNIEIKTGVLVLLENSQIQARAPEGQGGTIKIEASSGIYNSCGEDCINASGGDPEKDPGTVIITSTDTEPQVDTQEQEQEVQTSENIVTQNCGRSTQRRRKGEAVLAIVGREGLPPRPTDTLNVEALIPFDTSTTATETISQMQTETEEKPQYPPAARSWYVNDEGVTVFSALPIMPTGDYIPGSPQCPDL